MFQGMLGPVRERNNSQPDYSRVSPRTVYHQFSQVSLQQTSALLPAAAAIGLHAEVPAARNQNRPLLPPRASRGPEPAAVPRCSAAGEAGAAGTAPVSGEGRATLPPAQRRGSGTRPGPAERPRQRGGCLRGDGGAGVGEHGGCAA